MAKPTQKQALPAWVLPAVVIVGVLVLIVVGWRGLAGHDKPAGKDIEVRPNMYDFRAEAAKGNLGRRTGGPGFQQSTPSR